jgi:hypothetical protein
VFDRLRKAAQMPDEDTAREEVVFERDRQGME